MPLARNALSVLATQVVSAPLALATQVVLARMLSVEDRGVYAVATEFVILAVALIQLGWPPAVIFRLRSAGTPPPVVSSGALLVGTTTAAVAIGVCFVFEAAILERFLNRAAPVVLYLSAAAIPFQLFGQLFTGIARGLGRFDFNNLYQIALFGLLLIVTPTLLLLAGSNVQIALMAFAGVHGFVALAVTGMVLRATGLSRRVPIEELAVTASFGLKSHVQNVLANVHQRIDVFLLAWILGDPEQVAIYAIAVAVVNRIRLVPSAIAMSLFPHAAELGGDEAGNLTARVLSHSVLWVVLSIAVLVPASIVFVPLLFGAEYAESVAPLLVLLPGTAFLTIQMVLGRYFAARDQQHVMIGCHLFGTFLNVVANLLLIPDFGVLGAAAASLLSYSAQGLAILWAFRRHSGVSVVRALLIRPEEFDVYRRWFAAARRRFR